MTLDDIVLQKLAEWRPPREGKQFLAVPDEAGRWVVRLTAECQAQLGCSLWEMAVDRTGAPAPAGDTVGRWADRIAGRVTGLLEPLAVLEVDTTRDEALLRSNEPSRRKDDLHYYEVLLKGTRQATVQRYRATHAGQRREQIPFALTHETVAKLAADLTAD